jgi:hypothetical protein
MSSEGFVYPGAAVVEPNGSYCGSQGSQVLVDVLGADEDGAGEVRHGGAPGPVPCLSRNYCIGADETLFQSIERKVEKVMRRFSPYHRKVAEAMSQEIMAMIRRRGVRRIAFVTGTFVENITDKGEAARRWKSFRTNFLAKALGRMIVAWERQRRGAWHFHAIVEVAQDIKTGFDHAAVKRGDYRSASDYLRSLWASLREGAKRYGFGRTELQPLKDDRGEAISRYLGGYVKKGIVSRRPEDKGARLIEYVGFRRWEWDAKVEKRVVISTRKAGAVFMWLTDASHMWRLKARCWAARSGVKDYERVADVLGPDWAWKHRDEIVGIPISEAVLELCNTKGNDENEGSGKNGVGGVSWRGIGGEGDRGFPGYLPGLASDVESGEPAVPVGSGGAGRVGSRRHSPSSGIPAGFLRNGRKGPYILFEGLIRNLERRAKLKQEHRQPLTREDIEAACKFFDNGTDS